MTFFSFFKMSDRKRSKRRKDEYTGPGGVEQEVDKPAKEEFKIAKWIRKNVPTKKTKFLNHNVQYFNASKALDALMSSKFAQGDNCLFPTREDAVEFLDTMLVHKFFHRAKKVPVSPEELKGKCCKKNEKEPEPLTKKETKKEKSKEEKITDAESSHVEGKNEKSSNLELEKRKRKIRLDMHLDQVFVDGSEAYVWIYDPIPMHYWVIGTILVIGAIVICMFPLWPPILRKGVYYLSLAAAGFLVFILGLTVLRFIIFVIVWLLTGSKHHFWIFPNLTADVGFLESFWPLYQHEYRDERRSSKSSKKSKKKKKDKDSDAEAEDDDTPLLEPEKIENIKEHDDIGPVPDILSDSKIKDSGSNLNANIDKDEKDESPNRKNSVTPSESESESSQRSSTGKDFEIVDPADVETT